LKTILYLDQNYVSYLTKARLGVKVYADVAAYYENLYDALREAVQANTIVCPASQFHYSESELDTRLAPRRSTAPWRSCIAAWSSAAS